MNFGIKGFHSYLGNHGVRFINSLIHTFIYLLSSQYMPLISPRDALAYNQVKAIKR